MASSLRRPPEFLMQMLSDLSLSPAQAHRAVRLGMARFPWLLRAFASLALLLVFASRLAAQPIPEAVNAILARTALAGNEWSMLIEDASGGVVYYSRTPDLPLAPASNTKMYTTAAAFGLLGVDHQFETRVLTEGTLSGGALTGNLHLVSEHDPTWNVSVFSSNARAALDRIAQRVRAAGITSISGDVLCWGACLYNRISTGDIRSTARSTLNAEAATAFRAALIAAGVSVGGSSGGRTGFNPPGALLLTHRSGDMTFEGKPLRLDVACIPLNRVSHNCMTDLLMAHIGWELTGQDSIAAGIPLAIEWMRDVAGVDTTAMVLNDGSGLSRENRATARQTLTLTRFMAGAYPTWEQTLPRGCVNGTIGSRFCGTAGSGNVYAKTGSLGISIALSGYAQNPSDAHRYYFSFISNRTLSIDQPATRQAMDDSIVLMCQPGIPILPELRVAGLDPANGSARLEFDTAGYEVRALRVESSAGDAGFARLVDISPAGPYIIETRSGGLNISDYSEEGTFQNSSSHSLAEGLTAGLGSRFAVRVLGQPGDRARFTPALDRPGRYEVQVTCFNFASANALGITWRINDANGLRNATFDLTATTAGNQWLGVATIDYLPSQGHYIEFDNSTQSNIGTISDSRMNAAAVRLMPLAGGSLSVWHDSTLAPGAYRSYRLVPRNPATGALGRASVAMGVRRAQAGRHAGAVLVVDGNERWLTQAENASRLNHVFAARVGASLPSFRPVVSVSSRALLSGAVRLEDFAGVVWTLGEESTATETFSVAEQALLTPWLQGGGRLFVSGSEIGWDLIERGTASDAAFMRDLLRMDYVRDSTTSATTSASAQPGGLYAGIAPIGFSGMGMDIGFPDVLAPVSGGSVQLLYGTGEVAGVVWKGIWRTAGWGFPVETVNNASVRSALLARTLEFLLPPAAPKGLRVRAEGTTSVSLSWDAAEEADVVGYRVWRGDAPEALQPLTSELLGAPVFIDAGLAVGETYFYAVEALDADGEASPKSAVVGITLGGWWMVLH